MIKKFLLLTSLFLGAIQGASLTLDFSSHYVNPGQLFTVSVQVADVFAGRQADLLLGFGFEDFVTDPSVATFISATVPAPFVDDSGLYSGDPRVAGSTFPGLMSGDFSEPLTLAVLTFQAGPNAGTSTTVGISSDNLSNLAEGLQFLDLPVQDLIASGQVYVVPEPATVLLTGAGLAVVLFLTRRKATR